MNQAGELRFEGPGEVLRRRVSLLFGAAALFVLSLVLGGMGAPAWGALLEQALAVSLLLSFSWNAYRVTRRGVLFADASGLRLGDEKVAERSRIAAAFLVAPEEPVVRILRRGGLSLDVRLESEEKARALLTALGLGIGQSIASFSARSERGPVTVVILALMAGASALGWALFPMERFPGQAWFALVFAAWFALRYLMSFAHVDVGSDGVLIRQLGGQRFVAYGSLASVSVAGAPTWFADVSDPIALTLRSGERIRLRMGKSVTRAQLRNAMVQRIDEAREAFAGNVDAEGAMALVAPGGRTLSLWMSDVRALAGALHYRETRLDEDRLWRVLDDATAPPATRAGAALAISVLDQPSRLRLRVAAEACAEPKLRVALTRVADGATDPELEEALARLL